MTLNIATQCRIDEIVTRWISERKLFTAFEVSLAVQAQGIRQRHRTMRDHIHERISQAALNEGVYARTLMNVGAADAAWVYHPAEVDPATYVPLDRSEFGPPTPQPRRSRQRASRVTNSATQIPQGAISLDNRGRLCIPVRLLQQAGIRAGQRVGVQFDSVGGQLVLTPASSDNGITSYTTEPDGNIRITQRTLERAGLRGEPWYRVEGTPESIAIRKLV